jgi:ERCC4-type nuclease
VKRALACGDYAVMCQGRVVAAVERKSLMDLVSSLTCGKLKFALGELAALPRAALVVEDRYSQIFKCDHVRPAVVANGLAELQVGWPNVAVVFCETRKLAGSRRTGTWPPPSPGRKLRLTRAPRSSTIHSRLPRQASLSHVR